MTQNNKTLIFVTAIASLLITGSAYASEGITMDLLIEQIGRFHFLALHFPVVLIFLLPVLCFVSMLKFAHHFRKTIPWFWHAASISAIGAVILGLLLAHGYDPDDPSLLNAHRNWGIITAVVTLIGSIFLIVKKPDLEKKIPIALIIIAIIAFITLHIAADIGGTLVHGKLIILFK